MLMLMLICCERKTLLFHENGMADKFKRTWPSCHLYWPCISGATILRPEEGIIRSKASFGLISNPGGLKELKAEDCSELWKRF